jgi:autophagy-related protein 2
MHMLERYIGQFIYNKLNHNQLNVYLLNGYAILRDVRLDVQALNELGERQNWPLEFVHGSIGKVVLRIPWKKILTESSTLEVCSLKLTLQPKQRHPSATSMFESMWSSMTSSMNLAEDLVKKNLPNSPSTNTCEGVEIFAQMIDSILNRVKVTFVNSVIQIEHLSENSPLGVGLVMHIDS